MIAEIAPINIIIPMTKPGVRQNTPGGHRFWLLLRLLYLGAIYLGIRQTKVLVH